MQRRNFLKNLALFFLTPSANIAEKENPIFLDYLKNSEPNNYSDVGSSYLTAHPHEANIEKLETLIFYNYQKNNGNMQVFIENSIKRDFYKHKTVIIDGWMLSITEARLLASVQLFKIQNIL